MSRINIGNVDQYIEEANPSTTWNIELDTYDLSNAVKGVEFEDAISQPGNFTLDLVVDPGEINGGDRLRIDKEGVGAFNGVVTKPERSSQRNDTVKGGGAAELLRDIPINFEKINTNTQDVVNSVFSQLNTSDIQVGTNKELSDGNGNVSVRAEDEGALSVLNRTVLSHGGEWYVSYDEANDIFNFNVVNKLESGSVQRTFGDEAIRELRDAKVVDEEYDGVVVKGYGDGKDQIVGEYPVRNNWPSDPKILRYTDKTILSSEEANSTAESVYNDHTEWRNIYLYPANDNELLSLGDQVEIDDSGTGINNTFRVVHRKFTVDYGEGEGIEYVLSDRPVGLIDEAEDVRDQTDSQTDYMQGSRNVWGEKETSNATNAEPVTIDFEIPEDVEDTQGKNRVKKVKLNYSCDAYKTDSTSEDVRVSSTNLTKNNKVDNTNQSKSNRVDNVTDDEDPGVEDDNGVEIESGTQASVGSVASGGSSVVLDTSAGLATTESVPDDGNWHDLGFELDAGTGSDYPGADEAAGAVAKLATYTRPQNNDGGFSSQLTNDLAIRVKNEFDDYFPSSDGVPMYSVHPKSQVDTDGSEFRYVDDSHDVSIYIPTDVEFREFRFEAKVISGGDMTFLPEGKLYVIGPHSHDVEPDHSDSNGNLLAAPGSDGSVDVTTRNWVYDVDESNSNTVDNVSDSTSSTVDDVSDSTQNTVVSVDEDIVAGNTANEVKITVDGTDITNDIYGSNFSGVNEDREIDITQYLTDSNGDGTPDKGWHKIKIQPDSATYLKSRVFLDHKKDN